MDKEENRGIKILSFDMEGTLATPEFSTAVWHEGVPALYSRVHGLEYDEARRIVMEKYDEVGDQRTEWYDIKYWFQRFGLGDHRALMESYRSKVTYYPDAKEILRFFARRYNIVIASSSTREFLPYLLKGLSGISNNGDGFLKVFSSISDYGSLKTPDFYRWICQELDVRPQEMAHIGDNLQFDYLNARQAGIQAYHLDRTQINRHRGTLKTLQDLKIMPELADLMSKTRRRREECNPPCKGRNKG